MVLEVCDLLPATKAGYKLEHQTRVSLRIINEKPLVKSEKGVLTLQECNELIGIFTKSIEIAKKNRLS